MITAKIESLLKLAGRSKTETAEYLNMTKQSLSNKLNRGSFSADDLIKFAELTGAELYFDLDGNKIKLDKSDLRMVEDK